MKKLVSLLVLAAVLMACLSATALAASYVHISGNCHVRTGPGSWYDSIGIANSGSTLSYKGNSQYVDGMLWYNVTFNGMNGWVSSKYANTTDYYSGPTTYGAGGYGGSSDGYSSGSFSYGANVYIHGGKCNVRSGPSLDHGSLGTAYSGDVLFGTGNIQTDTRGGDWYSVMFKGNAGWVSSVYASLSGSSSSSKSSSSSSSSSSGGTVTASYGNDSFVRSGPGLGYGKLGVLYSGSSASYLGSTSVDSRGVAWYKISWGGSSGWVSSRYTYLH